jgi:MraZ protein
MAEAPKAKAFISTTTVKVDAKGRLSVPAQFRNQLLEIGSQEVVAYPNFKLPCLECCDWDRINAMSNATEALDMFSEQVDDIASLIFAQAQALQWDTTGRISLPQHFIAHTGITDTAIISGIGRTFRIWRPEDYHADIAEKVKRAREKGLQLTIAPTAGGRA